MTPVVPAATAALLCLVCACGNVTTNEDPDAGDAPPALLSSTPEDGAVRVSVLDAIELHFDQPLDPATVTPATIRLTNLTGSVVHPVDVTLDAEGDRVTVQPRRPLDHGHWLVRIDGVADPAGHPLATSLAFTTHWNQRVHTISYASGVPDRITRVDLDADGLPMGETGYYDDGADGTWDTADDVVTYVQDRVHELPAGDLHASLNHIAPGADTVWGTADDELGFFTRHVFMDDLRREVRAYAGPGPDGMVDTADDVAQTLSIYQYGDDVLLDLQVNRSPGPDGALGTADDVTESAIATVYDDLGREIDRRRHDGPGADQAWHTADDDVDWNDETIHGDGGYRQVSRDAGAITGYRDYQVADDGRRLGWRQVSSPGPDGQWQTADDPVSQIGTTEYDERELPVRNVAYGSAGADGTWQTADDQISSYLAYTHDPRGNLESTFFALGAGADGTWFTADDVPVNEQRYETDL
jgi:methionine-rich copper-binding protein CopC